MNYESFNRKTIFHTLHRIRRVCKANDVWTLGSVYRLTCAVVYINFWTKSLRKRLQERIFQLQQLVALSHICACKNSVLQLRFIRSKHVRIVVALVCGLFQCVRVSGLRSRSCSRVLISRRLNQKHVVHYTLSLLPHRHNKEKQQPQKEREMRGKQKEERNNRIIRGNVEQMERDRLQIPASL